MSRMVEIVIEKPRFEENPPPLLIMGISESKEYAKYSRHLDFKTVEYLKEILSEKIFTGKIGTSLLLPLGSNYKIGKILLVGLGNPDKLTEETARIVAGKIAIKSREINEPNFSIFPIVGEQSRYIEAMAEGIFLSLYKFDRYKAGGSESESVNIQKVSILVEGENIEEVKKIIEHVKVITDAVNFSRDLGNLPPNDCSPGQLVSQSVAMADSYQIRTTVLERYQMDEMKFDKCGGCNVIGILRAVAGLRLPIRVIGLVPCVENMPSSSSYRPGDIIKMFNDKTVEVVNTDAEGRIILADAMAYGIKLFKPRLVIDFATLTGASIIALGANVAAMVGTDDDLKSNLKSLSGRTGEKIWELPLWEEYQEQIKSHYADIKNIGGRPAGAITAAAFLSNFTDATPWVHLDIAGTAWTQDGTSEKSYNPKGATGFGIRTIARFFIEESRRNHAA